MYEAMAEMFAYGQPNAKMWLIGLEEHCGDANDLQERIDIRTTQPVEYFDLEAFHLQLTQGMPALNQVPVWTNAHAIYQGVYNQPTEVGRLNPNVSDLLLAEILPFPRPQHELWPMAYQDEFPTPAQYVAFALPQMSARLLQKVAMHQPEVLILHGKSAHDRWLRRHPVMGGGWASFVYGDRANETLKWRLHDGTLWLRTNNLVNNGHIRFQPAQISAVVELIREHRVPRL
jgi:hypothetical protein